MLSFVDVGALRPLRVVVNSGNGAAGPSFDAIAAELGRRGAPIEFIRVHHAPDHTFPNGIPNPLLLENHAAYGGRSGTRGRRLSVSLLMVTLTDASFLMGEVSSCPVSMWLASWPPYFWTVTRAPRLSTTRALFGTRKILWLKRVALPCSLRRATPSLSRRCELESAVYGGEMSAHHYFRDFAYCDSGMVPWLLIVELISKSGRSLGDLTCERFEKFPSSW